MTIKRIHIANDFSALLGPRFKKDGQFSGELFREKYLEPAVLKYDKVVINLDGLQIISASFFEEAFGGLVRLHDHKFLSNVSFETTEREYFIPKIEEWIRQA